MWIEEANLGKGIIALGLVEEVGGYLLAQLVGAQELEDGQEGGWSPGADAVPLVEALLGVLRRVEVY